MDSLASNPFKLYILKQTRITSHSKTHTENAFSNIVSHELISRKIAAAISDHAPKFLLGPTFKPIMPKIKYL